MKVGDLVKFKDKVLGYSALIGTIIAKNGEGFDILWSKAIHSSGFASDVGCIQTELPEFIEVINESR